MHDLLDRRNRVLESSIKLPNSLPPEIPFRSRRLVASIMAELTIEYLLEYSKEWINSRSPNCDIKSIPGDGFQTCCTYNSSLKWFVIKYGQQCVGDHFLYHNIGGWTHFHELCKFDLLKDNLDVPSLLSAAVIHEFSHLIAALHPDSHKYRGSHHKLFFEILKRIHRNNISVELKAELLKRITNENIQSTFTCGKEQIPQEQVRFWDKIKVRDEVICVNRFRNTDSFFSSGRIKKVNEKTVIVSTSSGNMRISKYNVFMPKYF
jgi:hypothetical protein